MPDGPPAEPAPDPAAQVTIDWRAHLGDRAACFIMLDERTGAWAQNHPERCQQRFRPFSTFKIPNALIGLDTGVIRDADTVIEWDRARYPAESWWPATWQRTNDLRSAFAHSAVPYFRAMAVRIGAAAMQQYVDRFGYGNRNIGGGLDRFWLDGELAISAREQIEFLRALHRRTLSVAPRSIDIVEDIMIHERGPGVILRAKTGTGSLANDHKLGWFVGYVERSETTYYFALNISGATFQDIPREQNMAITRAILVDLGAL